MEILEIAKIIEKNGGRLYLVGGAVRDELLKREVHDEDFCVVGIRKDKFETLFPNAFKRGKAFNVYDMEGKEFALARSEKKIGQGHKAFEVMSNENITIEEDLARRDITINSIAKDVITGEIVDPYNGQKDLKDRIIRATTNAFKEDPLRVYRVARFASKLEFQVEEQTIKMMKDLKNELLTLSKERVFDEFRKALLCDRPSIFFNVLKQADILDIHFEEIYNLIGSIQPVEYHPEGDSYNHTMIVLDNSAKLTDDVVTRFCCLVHDLGKGNTPKEIMPHHYGHEERGVELVAKLSHRLGIPNKWTKCGKVAAKEHMLGGIFKEMSPRKQVDFLTRVEKSQLGLDGLKVIVMCDRSKNGKFEENINFDIIGKEMINTINGKFIYEKYKITDEKNIGNLIRQERIEWIKKNIKKY